MYLCFESFDLSTKGVNKSTVARNGTENSSDLCLGLWFGLVLVLHRYLT